MSQIGKISPMLNNNKKKIILVIIDNSGDKMLTSMVYNKEKEIYDFFYINKSPFDLSEYEIREMLDYNTDTRSVLVGIISYIDNNFKKSTIHDFFGTENKFIFINKNELSIKGIEFLCINDIDHSKRGKGITDYVGIYAKVISDIVERGDNPEYTKDNKSSVIESFEKYGDNLKLEPCQHIIIIYSLVTNRSLYE